MIRFLISTGIYILANAIGLLVASLLLGESFTLGVKGFFVATLLLSAVEAVSGPLIAKIAEKNAPALTGSVTLVTTFVGLWITEIMVAGMDIKGMGTWLMATVLVWAGALIATLVLPYFMVKKVVENKRDS